MKGEEKFSAGGKGGPHPKLPLCREPWENYYILRRGIVPCCYGSAVIAPMSNWEEAWNSPPLQEIRSHLSQGKLSPYCLKSPSCPIVQRYLSESGDLKAYVLRRPALLRIINRLLFRIPGKIYRALSRHG
jgi:hypothetical protein